MVTPARFAAIIGASGPSRVIGPTTSMASVPPAALASCCASEIAGVPPGVCRYEIPLSMGFMAATRIPRVRARAASATVMTVLPISVSVPVTATPEQIERYGRLRAAESAFFGPTVETPAGQAVPVSAAP